MSINRAMVPPITVAHLSPGLVVFQYQYSENSEKLQKKKSILIIQSFNYHLKYENNI